jgi:predicted GNAT family acetyltransferase
MEIQINKDNLTVYHTEVAKEEEGKGLAKKLLDQMVGYARTHKLKVVPLCPYVHAQFKKHRTEYADLWDGK